MPPFTAWAAEDGDLHRQEEVQINARARRKCPFSLF